MYDVCFGNNSADSSLQSPHPVLCLSSEPIHLADASDDCKHMHSQSQLKHIQHTAPDNLWRRGKNGAGERNMLDESSISYKQIEILIFELVSPYILHECETFRMNV